MIKELIRSALYVLECMYTKRELRVFVALGWVGFVFWVLYR